MYACLAVTCHLHFWQNDRDFLRATVVTRGWNGYRNKSQHRKSTLEKKILPPFQQGFEPATFQSRVRCSNHWAIPPPVLFSYGKCTLIYPAVAALSHSLPSLCRTDLKSCTGSCEGFSPSHPFVWIHFSDFLNLSILVVNDFCVCLEIICNMTCAGRKELLWKCHDLFLFLLLSNSADDCVTVFP